MSIIHNVRYNDYRDPPLAFQWDGHFSTLIKLYDWLQTLPNPSDLVRTLLLKFPQPCIKLKHPAGHTVTLPLAHGCYITYTEKHKLKVVDALEDAGLEVPLHNAPPCPPDPAPKQFYWEGTDNSTENLKNWLSHHYPEANIVLIDYTPKSITINTPTKRFLLLPHQTLTVTTTKTLEVT